MKSRTHKRVSDALFPNLDPKKIAIANAIADDPPPWFRLFSQLGRIPGLNYAGHRSVGHTLLSAIIGPLVTGTGASGSAIVLSHLLLDWTRDYIIKNWGISEADLAEDVANMLYELLVEKKAKRKRRKHHR